MSYYVTWLRGLAKRGGKDVVKNIDARSLGRVADEIERLEKHCSELAQAALNNGQQLLLQEREIEMLRAALRPHQEAAIRDMVDEAKRLNLP